MTSQCPLRFFSLKVKAEALRQAATAWLSVPQDYLSGSPKSAPQKKWFLIKVLFSSRAREEEGLISFPQKSGREKVGRRQGSGAWPRGGQTCA